jgi:hypothetical protein
LWTESHHLVRIEHHLLVGPPVGGEREMCVGVDEPRQERRAGIGFDDRGRDAGRDLGGGPYRDDAGALDGERAVLDGAAAGGGHDARGPDVTLGPGRAGSAHSLSLR